MKTKWKQSTKKFGIYSNSTDEGAFVPSTPHFIKTNSEAFIFVCVAKANHDRVLSMKFFYIRSEVLLMRKESQSDVP